VSGDLRQSESVRRFAGLIVIVLGVLWLLFAGACSGLYFMGFFIDGTWRNLRDGLLILAPSLVIGWLIIARGRAMRRGL
jgi:hypothetical protein